MADCTETIETLRLCAKDGDRKCARCKYKHRRETFDCVVWLLRDAADAIEELIRKEKFHEFLWNTIGSIG